MNLLRIMRSYPLQVFRHRVYLPWLSILGRYGDIKRGVNTQQIVELSNVGVDPSVGFQSETTSYSKLTRVLTISRNKGFNKFLDIGCGLGRALLVANEVGFSDIYGVDISQRLLVTCQENLSKTKVSAHLTCSDVDNFEIPLGRLVVYIFNPFGEERMIRLVKKLCARNEQTLVIYHNPNFHRCFAPDTIFKAEIWRHFGLYDEKANFYLIPAKSSI